MNLQRHAFALVAALSLAFFDCCGSSVSPTSTEIASSSKAGSATLSATFEWEPVASSPSSPPSPLREQGTTYDTFRFTAKVTGGKPPYSYAWDFGDGGTADGNPVTHYYYRPGDYVVTLKVDDSAGASTGKDSPSVEIDITPTPFKVECDATPTSGNAPLTVRFRAWPDGNVGPIEWLWDFGDGATSATRLADHTYGGGAGSPPSKDGAIKCNPTPEKPNGPSIYLAVVTATDALHRSVSCEQKIKVN